MRKSRMFLLGALFMVLSGALLTSQVTAAINGYVLETCYAEGTFDSKSGDRFMNLSFSDYFSAEFGDAHTIKYYVDLSIRQGNSSTGPWTGWTQVYYNASTFVHSTYVYMVNEVILDNTSVIPHAGYWVDVRFKTQCTDDDISHPQPLSWQFLDSTVVLLANVTVPDSIILEIEIPTPYFDWAGVWAWAAENSEYIFGIIVAILGYFGVNTAIKVKKRNGGTSK